MKTKVAVLFGGRSVEHEVSVITGIQAFSALDRNKYDPIVVYISKANRFYTGEVLEHIENYRNLGECLANATQVLPVPTANGVDLIRYPAKLFGNNVVASFEVAIPAVHGTNVEDGTLMGMLEMLNIPYTGCDVTSAALGMDKFLMKSVLRDAGVPVLDAMAFSGKVYAQGSEKVLGRLEEAIGYPMIVKPVNLGSSVGIARADNRDKLAAALDDAFGYAPRVLVEQAVTPLREINCSVLGDSDGARASACEEPVSCDEILSYRDKYLSGGSKSGNKSGGMADLKRRCPADIPDELTAKVQSLAVKTFRALGCSGVARIDFLNNPETGELWVNEINTTPGSLSFYLWEATDLPFNKLLDEMIALAFKRQRSRDALQFSFDTNLLSTVSLGGAKGAKGGKL
ncbi:MAG: D-alanine--D-alanine ligase [Clostridia bacterium]|nr:D-alanine--D-alanine ligase [Clostridia bacterium]